jgi:hypothetical protein
VLVFDYAVGSKQSKIRWKRQLTIPRRGDFPKQRRTRATSGCVPQTTSSSRVFHAAPADLAIQSRPEKAVDGFGGFVSAKFPSRLELKEGFNVGIVYHALAILHGNHPAYS